MRNITKNFWGTMFTLLLPVYMGVSQVLAQTTISGTVTDADTKETLVGVNIMVKGKVIGTITDLSGKFTLNVAQAPPLTLLFSMVGYGTAEIEINSTNTTNLQVALAEQTMLGQEVVISASRVEESILQSPVSIEKMDILAIRDSPADTYYKAIASLKGVDVTTSSINFQIINARGFNSTGNTRFVQLTDGMDTQAPALNFPIGNLNGPSELDVESVEFIPGSASALYGPNAFNGILLVNSKSPFEYQGLSGFYKQGFNHFGGTAGEPTSVQPMFEGSIRYAKSFNNKIAFKINGSFLKAEDWYATDQSDLAASTQGDLPFNPGANRVHVYGDEVANNIGLLRNVGAIQQQAQALGLGGYIASIPDQIVSRTGYDERFLVDYGAKNFKVNGAFHYRINDRAELSYTLNYGAGTSVYTGAQRYSLKNFEITQHKLELKGSNYFVRAYTTRENSGESYIADLTGVNINSIWKDNSSWFGQYTLAYMGGLAQQGVVPGSPGTIEQQAGAHNAARAFADTGRYQQGSDEFNNASEQVRSKFIPEGSVFNDKSKMYMVEGQYDFREELDFMDLQVGAQYRVYELGSNGTIFADVEGNDITISEYGAFVQAAKKVLNDKLKVSGSLRYDKNENFKGQISPRLSGVLTQNNHNFRVSYQTGFRMPTTQAQHIDLNVVSARLIGGLPYYREKYDIFNNAFTLASVESYVTKVGSGVSPVSPEATSLLRPATAADFPELMPEQVKSIEIGYKSLLSNNKVMIDFAYYYNTYKNFITQNAVRKAPGPVYPIPENGDQLAINAVNAPTLLTPITTPGRENTFQTYTNFTGGNVKAHGAAFGIAFNLPKNYTISGNYNFNKLITAPAEGFLNDFNTPEHKGNIMFGNRRIAKNMGFNVAWRYQTAFRWESSFARGEVDAVSNFDAQLSYKVSSIKSVLKVGGSNILNNRYILNYGGPTIGAIYYISITFDELLN